MFPPFWGFPTTNSAWQQAQHELEQLQHHFDTVFRALLNADPHVVAQTPAEVIYSEGKLRLVHYRPMVEQLYPVPLLIIPSLINRYYILDLVPDNSFVEYLVHQGFDVYLVDWGHIGTEDRFVTFDQYLTGPLRRAVQHVCASSGHTRITLLGYSMGGTLTAIWSALYGQYVQNLVQIAAPINFHDDGIISQWTSKERFNVDLIVDTLGSMPLALMEASFRMLTPVTQIMQQIALADRLGDTDAVQDLLAIQIWMNNTTLFIGEAYRKYIKECYQENYLVQGKLIINRQRVDLARIHCPLLTVAAKKDYLCPPQSVTVLNSLVSSTDKQTLEVSSGHVGLVIGHTASSQVWPKIAEWLRVRSEEPSSRRRQPAPAQPSLTTSDASHEATDSEAASAQVDMSNDATASQAAQQTASTIEPDPPTTGIVSALSEQTSKAPTRSTRNASRRQTPILPNNETPERPIKPETHGASRKKANKSSEEI